jgi:hypothetical protein
MHKDKKKYCERFYGSATCRETWQEFRKLYLRDKITAILFMAFIGMGILIEGTFAVAGLMILLGL